MFQDFFWKGASELHEEKLIVRVEVVLGLGA